VCEYFERFSGGGGGPQSPIKILHYPSVTDETPIAIKYVIVYRHLESDSSIHNYVGS